MKDVSNDELFAACVAILSRLIDAERRAGGVHRSGGNYSTEALREIEQVRSHLASRR